MLMLISLAVVSAACIGSSNDSSEDQSLKSQNKSDIIFYAIQKKGIEVEEVYTSNGSEVKKAFVLEDSKIEDNSTIAFIIFRYSASQGVDKKLQSVLDVIYATLAAEPSIDGILVMPYDPSQTADRTNLIYTNRSHAREVALQNLPLRKFYNSFNVYAAVSELN